MKKISLLLSLSLILIFLITFSTKKFDISNTKALKTSSDPAFTKDKLYYQYLKYRDPNTGEIPRGIRSRELDFIRKSFYLNSGKTKNVLLSSNNWNIRGPFEIGGRVRAFDYDIRDENILIAGGVSSGMWKSTNAGKSWYKTSKPWQLHSVSCLVQDRRKGKENNWYYGTGEYWGNSASISGDGVYRSTNNGESWDVIPSTSTNNPATWDNAFDYIWNIVIDNTAPLSQDVIYVATVGKGIYRTTNAGQNWTNVLGSSSNATFSDVAITSDGVLYATLSFNNSNQKGIFRSTDGLKWTNITPPNFPKNYRRIVIGIAPSDENQVYFVGETPGYGKLTFNSQGDSLYHSLWKYTYKSGDGSGEGGIWEDRSENLPKPEPTRGQMNSQMGYNLVIKVKPDDPNVVFLGAVALYRSNSGFKENDWAWIGGTCPDNTCAYDYRYTNHHSDVHVLFFSKDDPKILYTGSDGGVHKTLNNMSEKVEWISLNNGFFTTQFYTVAISHGPSNSEKIIGGLQDNGTLLSRRNNLLEPWTNPLRADGFYCQITDDNQFYYASMNATYQPKIKIYRVVQDEEGNNIIQTRIDPIGGKDFIWNTPFLLDPNDNNKMYVAGGKMIWRNNNLSLIPNVTSHDSTSIGWDSLSKTRIDFKENVRPIGEVITALGISKNPANVLYYGTSNGNVYKILNADKGDPIPIKINTDALPKQGYVSSFAVDPDDANAVLLAYSNYGILSIFYTVDGGLTWVQVSGNLEENSFGTGAGPAVNWVEILKVNNRKVYFAGTSAGLFSTTFLNGPNTAWQMEGINEIGNVVIDMIDARHSDGFVAVGTHGTGVFDTYYTNLPNKPYPTKLVAPKNETKYVSNEVTLQWQPVEDAVFYDVQISLDPEFKDNTITLEYVKNSSVKFNKIEQGRKKYYWRVRTVNAGGASEFTEAWTFISAIEPPNLIFPENNQRDVELTTTFMWNKIEGATSYRFQLAKGLNIENKYIDTIITNNNLEIPNLEANRNHVWRVASIENSQYQGPFSNNFRFTTKNITFINLKNSELDVSIYPNPINENTNIYLNKIQSGFTSIKIYDINGILIDKLINRELFSGSYVFKLPIEKLNNGSYLVVIEIKDKLFIRKIIKNR